MIVAAGSGPVAAQNPSHGPLTYEEGSPLHRLTFTAPMEAAPTLAAGVWGVDLGLAYSNIFEQDADAGHEIFLDLERLYSAVSVRYGVSARLEVAARLLWETTGGGVLDGAIVAWHDFFGFGQANRDRFPEGAYRQLFRDGGGTVYLDTPRRRFAFEELRLSAKATAATWREERGVLAVKVGARVPTTSDPRSPERGDVSLAALTRVPMGSWYLHGQLGASTVRATPELEPILRDATTFFGLALERSFGWIAAVAQYQVQSPVLRGFDHREVDRAASNLVLGFSGALGERWQWDAFFQEDLPSDTPAIDFTIGVRLSRSW